MDTAKIYRYWGILALLAWGAAIIGLNLLRFDAYGIDEAAARALLINWTVADRVVNPIVTLGAPDFRALLFLPLGAYWSGSFIALKVFMLLALFAAMTLLHLWSKQHHDGETALIASGLLLIAPLSLMQINSVGAGPFLLLGFGLGWWLDRRYRNVGKQLGGWYFMQLLLVVTVVTIHPAGLAYPLALAWEWRSNPLNPLQRKQMHIGIGIATVFALLFSYVFGNPAIDWGLNPLTTLGAAAFGRVPGDPSPILSTAGILPALIIAAVIVGYRKTLLSEMLPRMLLLGGLLGLVAADFGWAMIILALVLYCGTPLLIRLNSSMGAHSFVGQRGLVMAAIFILATLFMLGDRAYRSSIINGSLDPHDQIIKALAVETEALDENFYTISQWPARTMLALKRPVFPLPPKYETPEDLLASIGQVDFIAFDPFDPTNKHLRDQLANLPETMETLIQQADGVIVKVKRQDSEPSPTL
ncbi:hypothetical protein Tel_00400 [Candidatus Tenderia electrophaga]|jgi:uncharacterized membrane protein (DUF485 family)|uniref:Glycosyltransferase RgtA/B/C/D-like domain-containing protein n=1 Tax=Candidatus Tenderia electrophaga TaxID=1748243 RepID=A0A0S2T998_9GAMM|nr:hypothetical protein Tel_00400 [Candidatus Tenderia electrophaga]